MHDVSKQKALANRVSPGDWQLLCHYPAFVDAVIDDPSLAERMAEAFVGGDRTPDQIAEELKSKKG